jgi:NADH:ubiquinone oxidoreductase subunit 2 (subunit N)
MAGIPPLAGFFSKYYIFLSAVEASSYFLVFIAIITSIISTFYYLRFVKIIWFSFRKPFEKHGNESRTSLILFDTDYTHYFIYGPLDFIMLGLMLFLVLFVFIVNYVESFSDILAASSMLCFNIII